MIKLLICFMIGFVFGSGFILLATPNVGALFVDDYEETLRFEFKIPPEDLVDSAPARHVLMEVKKVRK